MYVHTHTHTHTHNICIIENYTRIQMYTYRGADKSLARPGRKQATETEVFEFHISYL